MAKNIKDISDFTEDDQLKVVKAYLIEGLSHRRIQSQILGLPAPNNGGGFVAMTILHYYNITGDMKKILANKNIDDLIKSESGNLKIILKKLKEYIEEENRAEDIIKGLKVGKKTKTEIEVNTTRRIGQDKLRKYILDIYEHRCALCDIDKDDLLICSHIVPWGIDEKNRLNPQNAICLCAQHDKLFDKGYFSLDENYNIIFGKKADDKIINSLKYLSFRKPLEKEPDKELLKIHYNGYCK